MYYVTGVVTVEGRVVMMQNETVEGLADMMQTGTLVSQRGWPVMTEVLIGIETNTVIDRDSQTETGLEIVTEVIKIAAAAASRTEIERQITHVIETEHHRENVAVTEMLESRINRLQTDTETRTMRTIGSTVDDGRRRVIEPRITR